MKTSEKRVEVGSYRFYRCDKARQCRREKESWISPLEIPTTSGPNSLRHTALHTEPPIMEDERVRDGDPERGLPSTESLGRMPTAMETGSLKTSYHHTGATSTKSLAGSPVRPLKAAGPVREFR